jgi:hypothetical protein
MCSFVGVCVCVCVCVCARARRGYVFARICIFFSDFCLCVCMQQGSHAAGGRHIAHKFESGWEVGVIKAFDTRRALTLTSSA